MNSVLHLILLGFCLFSIPVAKAEAENAPPKIVLTEEENLEDRRIIADIFPEFSHWKGENPPPGDWLKVYVGKTPKADQPPMLGTSKVTKAGLEFQPRFGFEAGLTYSAKLSLPGQDPIWQVFELKDNSPQEPARIAAFYPTGNKLPENLLRIYLHFSAPMSQGRSYQYLHLFEESGEEVQRPFLTLPQELWSADGKRLTVLLDPGRVKQGLKPREQSGPVLVPGHKYTLTIDQNWPDAKGRPLEKGLQKIFETTKADIVQPNPDEWAMRPPKSGSRDSLTVAFDEPLDHGMLERVLEVVDGKGNEVLGEIRIDQEETRWQFTPEQPWGQGQYSLRIASHLEDRVGNSIARPFEVDLNEPPPPPVPKIIEKVFRAAE